MEKLTALALAVLELESEQPPLEVRLAAAERLGLSSLRYWQMVIFLIDHPEAAARYPDTIARLSAQRELRARLRRRPASS